MAHLPAPRSYWRIRGSPCLKQASSAKRLDQLEESLSACRLADMLDDWQAWVIGTRGPTGTDREYRYQVESFVAAAGPDATSADIRTANVTSWLTSLTASTGTRRKYFYALKSFVRYLRLMGALAMDPCAWTMPERFAPPEAGASLSPTTKGKLEALPETFRAVLKLVDLDELTYREAATELGVPVGTVMSRLHRGRKLLASQMQEPLLAA